MATFIPQGWKAEVDCRLARIAAVLRERHIDAALFSDNMNLYYTAGRVFCGFTLVWASGAVRYFVRRPVGFEHDAAVTCVRKPELIPQHLDVLPRRLALMADVTSHALWQRLAAVFAGCELVDGAPWMRLLRSVKTPFEQQLTRISGQRHVQAYALIPGLYRVGMTDVEFQIEIERLLRRMGNMGYVRTHGDQMEMGMGSLLCGDNADVPGPFDFALGGAGSDPSLPVGSCGVTMRPGMAVMVDMGMNHCGYTTDMTRTYSLGTLPDEALRAHEVSVMICHRLAREGREGVPAARLYEVASQMSREAGLSAFFMGHRQQAGFVGHGVGLETNEAPVLSPRSRDVLISGQVLAIEPKFVLPGVGAVGIENTYLVCPDHLECLTPAPEPLTPLNG